VLADVGQRLLDEPEAATFMAADVVLIALIARLGR
jgi:hypothetical protein